MCPTDAGPFRLPTNKYKSSKNIEITIMRFAIVFAILYNFYTFKCTELIARHALS